VGKDSIQGLKLISSDSVVLYVQFGFSRIKSRQGGMSQQYGHLKTPILVVDKNKG